MPTTRRLLVIALLAFLATLCAVPVGYCANEAETPLVTVAVGDLPILLTAPHGGRAIVPGVAKRQGKGAKSFTTKSDLGTDALTELFAEALEKRSGKRPYVVIARFHRKFVDANRAPKDAFESSRAEAPYSQYHDSIAAARRDIIRRWGGGILVDIHGQGADPATVFRGTQNGRTVKHLVGRFGEEALVGSESLFGHLAERGLAVVPKVGSDAREDRRFNGGYTVGEYGSRDGGSFDAIQLELGRDLRRSKAAADTADRLAAALLEFAASYLPDEEIPPLELESDAKSGKAVDAGFGSSSIAPRSKWVPLAGYGFRGLLPYHEPGDAVMARVMLLRSGGVTTGVVTLDLIGVQRTIVDALRARPFPKRVEVSVDDLIVSASHTHHSYGGLAQRTGAPYLDTLFLVSCGTFQRDYFDHLVDSVWNAIVEAWDDLGPACVGVRSEAVAGLSRNRRRSLGVTDPELTVLKVTDVAGRVRGLMMNYAAHPVLLGADNLRASAGFPGVACAELERRYPDATALFTQGAGGDQSPRVPAGEYVNSYERVVAFGVRLADEVDRIQGEIRMDSGLAKELELSTRSMEVKMPVPVSLHDRLGARESCPFQQVILGDVILVTAPGEPCAQIGLDLKDALRERGFRVPIVVGLAQDHVGYFVHHLDYSVSLSESHEYEKSLNFYGPGVGAFFLRVHAKTFAPKPLVGRSTNGRDD